MYKILIENECDCFKKSDLQNNTTELLRSTAFMKANQICNIMNNTFCKKHKFVVVECQKILMIKEGTKQRPVHCCGDGCCFN